MAASDLSEVLAIEGVGEIVEELGEVSGGLVAEFVGYEAARPAHSRISSTDEWYTTPKGGCGEQARRALEDIVKGERFL